MNKQDAQRITGLIKAWIGDGLAENGYEVTSHKARYGDGLTLTLEITAAAPDGLDWNPNTPAAKAFTRYAAMEGIDPAALGQTFTAGRIEYRITGYRTRAPKRPIETTAEGRVYVWPAAVIAKHYPNPDKERTA